LPINNSPLLYFLECSLLLLLLVPETSAPAADPWLMENGGGDVIDEADGKEIEVIGCNFDEGGRCFDDAAEWHGWVCLDALMVDAAMNFSAGDDFNWRW
jgi:hypothetical protein